MRVFTSSLFDTPLPKGHRFPGQKYGMLRRRLLNDALLRPEQILCSPLAERVDIRRAHTAQYVDGILNGTVQSEVMRRVGFAWTPHLAERARANVGGAVAAARLALEVGISGQLAGGTHHAHANFGSGFCVFNDHAVTALTLLEEGIVERVAIVDLDVHQGDGNAAILGPDQRTFVLSIHGEKNFPFRKVASDLDIGLVDGAGDNDLLSAVERGLAAVEEFRPDIVLYQAGVDPLTHDRLGRLDISFSGLMERDRMVFAFCRRLRVPICMAIGGGYAEPISLSVEAYANTYRVAKELYGF